MRILLIIHQFMPEFHAGTEVFTLNIAKMHQHNGHYVDVLTCSIGDGSLWPKEIDGLRHAMVDGVRVFGLRRDLLSEFAEIGIDTGKDVQPVLKAFLDRGNYDVVHVTHAMRMLPAVELIRDRGIPYLVTLTDYYSICYRVTLTQLDGSTCSGPELGAACRKHCLSLVMTKDMLAEHARRLSSYLKSASQVIACSDFVESVFRSELPDLPIRTLAHGIDLLRFRPASRDSKNSPIVFGFIGLLSEHKGAHVLAEAFARAAPSNARLELIGPVDSNSAMRDRIAGLKNPNIVVRDAIAHDEIPAALAGFDVLCLPSLWPETFSLALHEGFASGLPALVSDLGWPAQIVANSGCGKVVRAGDVVAWQQAITEITGDRAMLDAWRDGIPLQNRIEEEAFFYDQLYRRAVYRATKRRSG